MKGNDFLAKANKIFNLPYDRLMKHATALRKHELFPDGRARGVQAHVTASQAAYLVRLLSINPNPCAQDYDRYVFSYLGLGSFIEELAKLIVNSGEEIAIQNVQRISFSLDRNFVSIVYKPVHVEQALREAAHVTHYATKETDKVFGDTGPKAFERFAHLKKSALIKLATALQYTGMESTPDEPEAEEISIHINSL